MTVTEEAARGDLKELSGIWRRLRSSTSAVYLLNMVDKIVSTAVESKEDGAKLVS